VNLKLELSMNEQEFSMVSTILILQRQEFLISKHS